MLRVPRLSLGQSLVLVAFVAFVIALSTDLWRKLGTGVSANHPVLAISPDGRWLAMNASFRPLFQNRHPVVIQDLAHPEASPKLLESHRWIISDMQWSRDGSRLYTSSGDHTVRTWDVESGEELSRIEEPTHAPGCLALSPDGRFVASGDHPLVHIWETGADQPTRSLKGLANWVACVAFSPAGDYLVAADINGKIQIWETETWSLVGSSPDGPRHTRFVFTPDGRLIMGGDRKKADSESYESVVKIHAIPSFELVDELPVESYWSICSLALSADGRLLAAGHGGADRELERRAVTVWDLPSRKQLQRFEFTERPTVRALEFSGDGEILYGADTNGLVKAIRWREGEATSIVFARPGLPWMLALIGGVGLLVAWRLAPRTVSMSRMEGPRSHPQ